MSSVFLTVIAKFYQTLRSSHSRRLCLLILSVKKGKNSFNKFLEKNVNYTSGIRHGLMKLVSYSA